jgi:hypothetical protein
LLAYGADAQFPALLLTTYSVESAKNQFVRKQLDQLQKAGIGKSEVCVEKKKDSSKFTKWRE